MGRGALTFSDVSFPGGASTDVNIFGVLDLQAVPEPSSLLLATAAAGAGVVLKRRRSASG